MKTNRFSRFLPCLAFVTLATAFPAAAADLTWDGNTVAGITNNSAAWDAASVWFDGSTNVSFTANDNVTFTASGTQTYNVTTGTTGPYAVGNMVLNSTSSNVAGINVNAPAIVLSGSATTAVGHTGVVQLQGVVSGGGSFTLDSGELRLINNSNTFSGGITLNGGTLRVGNGNGTGNPQTAGSLGTGIFTINGGTIFQNQGATRTQAVAAVIGGDFALNGVAGGGLQLGSDATGTHTVSLGSASRTITVSENSDGTGASAVLGLRDLTNTAGGAIIKEGAGVLRIQGTSTAGITVNEGSLEVSGGLGATNFTMNSGTVWRKTTATALTLGSNMTLNSASLVNNDTLLNPRNSVFQTFQVSGTSSVFLGSGLTIQATGTSISGFNVRNDGVLGGNGTLQTAATQAYSAGVTTLTDLTDSVITLNFSGFLSPGTPGSLNSTIATLSFGSLVWQGSSTAAPMKFNLGSANQSDRLALSGNLGRTGATETHQFDFLGTGVAGQTYTLITFATVDPLITQGMFVATNLASGITGTFALNANSLTFTTDPGSGSTPFETWVGGPPFNLAGIDALPGSDYDKDGTSNLAEFALDGDPTSGANNGKQFVKMATVESAPNVLTLTIAARTGASFSASGNRQTATIDGIIYTIEAATDLANWGTPVVTPVIVPDVAAIQAGLPSPSAGWTYQTFRCSGNAGSTPKAFLRARFEETAP